MTKKPRKPIKPPTPKITDHPHPLLESEFRMQGTVIWKYVTGRIVKLPDGISPFYPKPDFDDDVRTIVKEGFEHGRRETVGSHVGKVNRELYKLFIAENGGRLVWEAHAPGAAWPSAACGYFDVKTDRQGPYLLSAGATAAPYHQGQGIYPAILHAVKKKFKMSLVSDSSMSPGTLLVWMSEGFLSKTRKRYQINPPRKHLKQAIRGALEFAYAESAMRDRIVLRA